jgi:hypothetical protein
MKKSSKTAMLTVLTASWILTVTGCKPAVLVIESDKQCVRMPAGAFYAPKENGWFVPDARMLDILNQLDKAKLK